MISYRKKSLLHMQEAGIVRLDEDIFNYRC